jgi:anti-sigma-K factor RskA
MNTQAYIESGILEEYVLGVASPQEKREVECLSQIYPEVKAELLRLEATLEQYALQHQRPAPAGLKDKIFAQMTFGPAVEESGEEPSEEASEAHAPFTPAGATEIKRVRPLWGMLAVAASVLLAIFGVWTSYQLSQADERSEQLAAEVEDLRQTSEYNEALASFYRDPDFRIVRMPGVEKSPQSTVVALWNQQTNEVFLDVQNLPVAPAGKQYQLWGIVNGAPVDLGVLDRNFSGKVLQMKTTEPNPAAFAITLEKEGGSPNPTLEEMYVLGNV